MTTRDAHDPLSFLSHVIINPLKTTLGVVLAVAAVFNGALWFVALWFASREEGAAVLHYSQDIGIDFIGEAKQVTTLPLVGLSLLAGNVVFGSAVKGVDKRTAWILWGIVPLVQVILIATFFLIWQANNKI